MWNLQKSIFILFSFSLLSNLHPAQEDELFRHKYSIGCESIKRGDFKEGEAIFRELVAITPSSNIGILSRFLLGFVLYKQGRYNDAIIQFNEFIRRAPDVAESDWARFYIGNSNFKLGNYGDAAKYYVQLIETNDNKLKPLVKSSIENLLWGYMTVDELDRLRRLHISDKAGELVSYYIIKRLENQKATSALFQEVTNFLERYPYSEYKSELESSRRKLEEELTSELTIIVLLPFSGLYKSYGERIYKGIQLAFDEYRQAGGKRVRLEKLDTKGDPLVTVFELKNALKKTKPIAVIGPVRSECAIPAGITALEFGIPIITPSANKDGISRLGYGIFQLSPSIEEKCRVLASYAIGELGYSTFAILAVNDEYGLKAGKSFASKISELGGVIVKEIYYPEGTMDLTAYLDSIRAPIVKIMSTYTKTDSTDTVFYDRFGRLKPPSEWIVHIDGFFIPTYTSELENILPQVQFRYIDTKFLGAIGWKDELITNKFVKDYVDGAFFVPDEFYFDNSTPLWKNFEKKYKSQYIETPDRFSALGYDAGKIIVEGLKKKAILPTLMADFIAGIRDYQGVSGNISFNLYGASEDVQILKIEGKRVVRVK